MGKSPGKWIKTVLLGRKTSKSNLSKGVKVENNAVPEQPEENLHSGHPVVTETAPYQSRDTSGAEEKSENGIPGAVSSEVAASLPVQQQPSELNDAVGLSFTNDEDTARLELAAIKAQAAFRGYLARRAFWALKGIIRLQALIRGHLVRRQAVATLHCVHYIVKLQALVRGRMVRISYPGLDLSRKGRVQEIQGTSLLASAGMTTAFRSQKLSTNAFAIKLLSLLPKAMPLSLQYGPEEPNSAWIWLQRWSLLHFWEPFTPPKVTAIDVKSQAKLTAAGDKGKSKRTLKKVASTTTPGENTNSTPFEFEKPKRNPRKLATHHQIESSAAQEQQAQSELEKVKRNLRKVSASSTMATTTTSVVAATEKPETENEKSVEIPGKVLNITVAAADVADSGTTTTNLPADQTDKSADDTEMTLKPLKVEDDDEPVHLMHPDENEQNSSEIETKVVTDNAATTKNEESDQTETENQKIIRRRKSLPVKQEYHENVSQNSASVPSYMAATESAKAKLRLQASIKLSEDGGENGFVRRHSLPNPGNGKFNSISPRVQKPGQVNGKGGIKTNKSLSASRDERVFQPQPGWRR